MQLYTKNDSGEFHLATEEQLSEAFKEKSDPIVARRIAAIRDKELEAARPEFEKKVRAELETKLKAEAEATVKSEYEGKLAEANKAKEEAELGLRRKTIAAEYGFKAEAEKFLGNGTEEEMRANADALKANFGTNTGPAEPEKTSATPISEAAEKYGLDVKI